MRSCGSRAVRSGGSGRVRIDDACSADVPHRGHRYGPGDGSWYVRRRQAFAGPVRVVFDGASCAAVRSRCACFAAASGATRKKPSALLAIHRRASLAGWARLPMQLRVSRSMDARQPAPYRRCLFVLADSAGIGGQGRRPAGVAGCDSFSVPTQPGAGIVVPSAPQSSQCPPQFMQSLCMPEELEVLPQFARSAAVRVWEDCYFGPITGLIACVMFRTSVEAATQRSRKGASCPIGA